MQSILIRRHFSVCGQSIYVFRIFRILAYSATRMASLRPRNQILLHIRSCNVEDPDGLDPVVLRRRNEGGFYCNYLGQAPAPAVRTMAPIPQAIQLNLYTRAPIVMRMTSGGGAYPPILQHVAEPDGVTSPICHHPGCPDRESLAVRQPTKSSSVQTRSSRSIA